MKVWAGIPAYDGKVCVETVRSLLQEQTLAHHAGVDLCIAFLPGCSLITMARNQMAADFLATDCDRLVFVDADVAFEPGALVRLALHPVDVVGGAYRYKSDFESYPVILRTDVPELWADPQTGLLEVASLPGGFLAISRTAFERLKATHPDRGYTHCGFTAHAYFHAPVKDGLLYGEDAAFCADWREIGGQVWLDPELTLTHVGGVNHYTGHIGNWLKARPAPAIAA